MRGAIKEWFTLVELAEAKLPGLPTSARRMRDQAERCGWDLNPGKVRKAEQRGGGMEYHVSVLPSAAGAKLAYLHTAEVVTDDLDRSKMLWTRFEALSSEHKTICSERLATLTEVEEMRASGIKAGDAVGYCSKKAGIATATYYEWRQMVEGWPRRDWLAALAPSFSPVASGVVADTADCHPKAWEYLKSDFLRPEKPKFSACFRRMEKIAKREGWLPILSERTLRRRLEKEVGKAVALLTREGKDKARTLYPAQRRTRAHLHAMQMANMDGHKVDVFVSVPWSKKPVRFILLGIQDLFSGKIVAWRLTEAETWESVRLCIGDMVEAFGIPEAIYLDNGKAFSSKWITGEARQRFRFKVREEDPRGLLATLGVETHFTRPYAGQSKPIERAWGDLAENIAKHPFCAGAYTGNKPSAKPENYMSRAIPFEEFKAHVAAQVEEHNAQTGRRAENCKGRSFDETFAASMALSSTIVRVPSPAQASLWLLASEAIKARPGSGEIHYQGNRYWSRELNQWAGQKVIIRFDPDALHEPVKVYDLKNRLICEAQCVADAGFDNIDDARMHARALKTHQKAVAAAAEAHTALTARQLGEIYYRGSKPAAPAKAEPIRPAVTRLVTGNLAQAAEHAVDIDEFNESFSRGLARATGGASILEFPKGDTADR
ncbi:transposase domain-containing protein [Pararhizobium sp. A13]|uniref:transposase domain-containing protein n=1 Tax=Pararhizobium sp. A13 TaxID=3133975 RepID=UPI003249DD7B